MLALLLLVTAGVMIACILFQKISSRIGIPSLLAFIVLGMLFGSDGLFKIPFSDYRFAEQICSVALIFIMFYGGFGLRWQQARRIAVKASILSSAGTILTALFTGLFCHFALGMSLWEGLLAGSVLSSTDAASVFSILRSRRLNLRYRTAPLLEMESGSNDPFSYMLTVIVLSAMAGEGSVGEIVLSVLAQLGFGLLFGFGIALLCVWLMKHIWFAVSGLETIFIFAAAILAYAAPAALGGNGYLSVYIVGIVLGNSELQNKKTMVSFFDVTTGLMQMAIFFLLGLLSFPSRIPSVLLPALGIALFLTFVARPAAVGLLMTPFGMKWRQQCLVSWAGLRGAASIVFAIMATVSEAETPNDVFHITFTVVLFSILLQGSLLPWMARRLKMIDRHSDIMKTFSDYSEQAEVQFTSMDIGPGHAWAGRQIRELCLPPGMLVAGIQRDSRVLVPDGRSEVRENDTLVLGTAGKPSDYAGLFYELRLGNKHPWCGKQLREIRFEQKLLVVMVRRGRRVIIPNGDTRLRAGDLLVLHLQGSQTEPAAGIIARPVP